MRVETTARIEREHLRDLLDRERITAQMPAVTLTGLLTLPDEDDPPMIVRFHTPGPLHVLETMPRSMVVAISFSTTMLFVMLLWHLL
jgi:hypothetical protein